MGPSVLLDPTMAWGRLGVSLFRGRAGAAHSLMSATIAGTVHPLGLVPCTVALHFFDRPTAMELE